MVATLAFGSAGPCVAPREYVVAVRALCEFSARRGDLDLRFTPSPSAREGQAGHAVVTGRRPPGYQCEIALSGNHGRLQVRGRADGYDAVRNRVEEIKTHRGDPAAIAQNQRALHWAQARVYGHLLCAKLGLDAIEVALIYFDIVTERETELVESCSADFLRGFFRDACERFAAWADQEVAHRAERDRALAALAFPHGKFRNGQRDLAKAVYRAARDGHCLMAQAPTGIGKTMGTVFPALKAAPGQLDKVFFLCAKTAGRQLALAAIAALQGQARAADRAIGQPGAGDFAQKRRHLPLRTLELVARDQACVHPEKSCHGASCPLARGFYDRLPQARQAMLAQPLWDRAALQAMGRSHQVCPYFLAQELARWSDVVIGDYHYYFDHNGMLHGMVVTNHWRVAVLVDEAHNLLERGRMMYTARLRYDDIQRVRRQAPDALRAPAARLARAWRGALAPSDGHYRVLADPPRVLVRALEEACDAIGGWLAQDGAPSGAAWRQGEKSGMRGQPMHQTPGGQGGQGGQKDQMLRFYFDALRFLRIAEQSDTCSLWDVDGTAAPARGRQGAAGAQALWVRNLIPAPFLAPRFAVARAVVLFSATLVPDSFYADTLGLPAACATLDVPPPFDPDRLSVRLVGNVSTRYADRARSLDPIVDLIGREYAARPGNYLCFASSFDYLEKLYARVQLRHPALPAWAQRAGMDGAGRTAFLDRFQDGGRGIGFAVLGGSFGEGIDLPGSRLIGAFVVTLGLPQWNPVNEQIRQRMQARFGSGYEYAYLYPGLQKVVQAAGRVIRSEADEGRVWLIDERFRHAAVRRLLPSWWRLQEARA